MEKNPRSRQIFVITLLITLLCSILLINVYVQIRSNLEQLQMEQIIENRSNKVEKVLSDLLYKTQVLSALTIQNNGEVEDFERAAKIIVDDPAIRNVILAPGGIVEYVYPLKSNEAVIGLDYFSEASGNKEAIKAKETGELVLGGPFELKQGGQALVGRMPVYIEGNFWGLCSVTLNYPQALSGAELEQLEYQNMAYEIWRINPDDNQRQIIAESSYKYNKEAKYIEKDLNIINANWHFRLSPVRAWYEYPETWLFLFFGIIISSLFASLIKHNLELSFTKKELERQNFTDPLTGILNRRGIKAGLGKKKNLVNLGFAISIVDLDGFKKINDNWGHFIGDKVLCQFARIVETNLSANCLFGRLGGDEFLLLQFGNLPTETLRKFWEAIKEQSQATVMVSSGELIDIPFSVGFSKCPDDGDNLDQLIDIADKNMYLSKKQNRN